MINPTVDTDRILLDLIKIIHDASDTIIGKRGFSLSEYLDDIALSNDFESILCDVFSWLIKNSYDEILWASALDDFNTQLECDGSLALILRISSALEGARALMCEDMFDSDHRDITECHRMLSMKMDDIPVRIRRCLRHIFRGFVAMLFLLFDDIDDDLRLVLLEHAAIGSEDNIRIIASISEDEELAKKILLKLRIDPINIKYLLERQQQLIEARELISEIQENYIPEFQLPPEPTQDIARARS